MTQIDRAHGSAAGIPEPPRPASTNPIGEHRHHGRRRRRGVLWWVLIIPAAIAAIVLQSRASDSDSPAIESLEAGDCFSAPDDASFTADSIDVIDCAQPHNHEVYAIGTTSTAINTTVGAEQNPEIIRICRTEVGAAILAALSRTPGVTPGVLATQGKPGRLVCTANTTERTGSLIDVASAP